ncbi:mitogen-activated protein kinase kinase kinase 20-like isoform X2 [Bolinopsis microptera]|uniref:mitogen-activated protein kinase kinase kinase 20-like isoform X2 n=1 Tax=Bolinopsis microptera TaxID=2820187 RepID=UPI003078D0DC
MLSNKPYLEIGKDELNFSEQIGRGAQGAVYKALWKTKPQVVAVKHVLEFDPEIVVLKRIQHKHIVQFLGAVEEVHFKAIVLEYAEHGSLYQVIREDPPDFEQMLIWSRHIALGLNYLHNGIDPRIIHRDLKSRNVVIASAKRIAKICDFGSSRELNKTVTRFSRLHGTVAWMAPEVMRQSIVSEKCDTYSFAMLLWELITGKIPFEGEEDPHIMFGVCQRKRRPLIPEGCPEEFANLIKKCWEDEADKRPSIEDINKTIGKMLLNETLTEEVDDFLSHRQQWVEEFDIQIEDIRKEFESIEKQWAKKLEEKENEIESLKHKTRFLNSMVPEEKGVCGWKEIEVVQWINYNLPDIDYSNEFFENSITGNRLLNLTENELLKMGISSVGHRMDILKAINELKNKIQSLENFPPLMNLNTKQEKAASKNTGTLFTLCLTFGNNYYPGTNAKWNLFVYVEGDKIALKSIKCVEFRIAHSDVVKRDRMPFVMENFRYDKPKSPVECKLVFRGNIIKPKSWSKSFPVVCAIGGFNESCEIEIYLNEEHVPSAAPSHTSSLSSFSSFNVIDNWQTTAQHSQVQGAWKAGPPPLARSPGFTTHPLRRDSSPFSNRSPNMSPRTGRRKFSSGPGNGNTGLNRSSTSPAKMSQMVRSRSHDTDKDPKSRDMKLSLQNSERRVSDRFSDVTPTHDPHNPRFTSARSSLVDDLGTMDLNTTQRSEEGFTFGSLGSADINMQFGSAHTTIVDNNTQQANLNFGQTEAFKYPEVSQDTDVTPKKSSRKRGISVSSTLSANSTSSIKDLVDKLDQFPEGCEFQMGTEDADWCDKPTWGVSSDTTSPPQQPPALQKESPKVSSRTQPPFNMPAHPIAKDKISLLARDGKLSYADILKCPSDPVTPAEPVPSQPTIKNLSTQRNRKNSSGSNASSEKSRGSNRRRGSRGSLRGRGKPRGKSFSSSPRYNNQK